MMGWDKRLLQGKPSFANTHFTPSLHLWWSDWRSLRDGEFRPLPLSAFQSFAADDEWRDECNAPCQAKHVCHVRKTMDDGAREGGTALICSFYSFSLICGIKREREEGQCRRSKKRRKLLRDLLTILRELSHCRQSVDTRAWGLGPFFVGQHT